MNAHGSTIILPAMRQPAPPHIAAVVDTSGSISQDELNSFVGEIGGIMRSVGLSQGLTIVPCDTGAKDIIRVRSTSQLPKVEFRGGGGTDMGAGITAVLGLKRFAHIVIVLTDGYTPWPANCPDPSRHYIAVVTNPDTASNVPQWMRVITIK
jgi:predicted metal-dependent peptidase